MTRNEVNPDPGPDPEAGPGERRLSWAHVVVGASAAVAAAVVLRLLLDPILGPAYPIATLFLAVLAVAAWAGRRAALFTTILGALAAARFLFQPRTSIWLDGLSNQTGMAMYLLVSTGISLLGGALHEARRLAAEQARVCAAQATRFRSILQSLGDAVVVTDEDGQVEWLNPMAETLTGWPAAEASGKKLGEVFRLVDPSTRKTLEDQATLAVEEGAIIDVEEGAVLVSRDGTERPIDDRAAPVKGDGSNRGAVLVFRDVSERNAVERALRESEQRHRLIAELTSDFTYHLRFVGDGRVIPECVGEGISKLIGGDLAAEGPDPCAIFHPDDIRTVERSLARARHGRKAEAEVRLLTGEGRPRWIRYLAQPVLDPNTGEVVGVLGAAQDVSERKSWEEALANSERELRRMADCMPQIVWAAGADGKVEYYNRRWYEYTGDLESGGPPVPSAPHLHPEDASRASAKWEECVREGRTFEMELRIRGQDGEDRWHLARCAPVVDGTGGVVKWYGTSTDIHELKRAEEARVESIRRKGRFLAVLAHELRNPLAPIRNALVMMRRKGLGAEELEEHRSMAERQVLHLSRLVNELMDLNRIDRGEIALQRRPVEVNSIVREAAAALEVEMGLRGHAPEMRLPARSPVVSGDAMRLEQVVWNLLSNATKFTEPGGTIRVSVDGSDGRAVIEVRDSGVGIPSERMSRLFDPFAKTEEGVEGVQGGLGIGLGLVKSLVELHGGTVEARSDGLGAGAVFTVRLPVVSETLIDSKDEASDESVSTEAKSLERHRVLVVDDNTDAASSLGMLLSRVYGQQVKIAHDGPTAVALAKEFRPDLVVLDIGLPGMDGYAVARALRAAPEHRKAVLIALTGWGQDSDRRQSAEAGFDLHLVKPADPDEISSVLSRMPVSEW